MRETNHGAQLICKHPRGEIFLCESSVDRPLLTQAAFAAELGVDRSCLSRYESEALGAPTSVLNHCLQLLAKRSSSQQPVSSPIERALLHAR